MKVSITLFMAVLWFVFGWVLSSIVHYESDLLWLASPLAILVSASMTILVAFISWSKNKKAELTNRTITYLMKEFPFSERVSKNIGAVQKKIMQQSPNFAIRDDQKKLLNFHLDIYESTFNELSQEEIDSLEYLLGVYETIFLNIKYEYFDEAIVKDHLGVDFGVQFWLSCWPHVIYRNEMEKIYMAAKGLNPQNGGGVYNSYREYIYSYKPLERSHPVYGEKAGSQVHMDSISNVVQLSE